MTSPAQLKYASSHEWVQDLGDGTYAVGISNHAQEALGDIVFLEFPKVGRVVKAEEAVAVVESVKAANPADVDALLTAEQYEAENA